MFGIAMSFGVILANMLGLVFVVPSMAALYADMGSALPFSTRLLLSCSGALAQNGFLALIALVFLEALICGALFVCANLGHRKSFFLLLLLPIVTCAAIVFAAYAPLWKVLAIQLPFPVQ